MATNLDIIKRALRKLSIIPAATEPDQALAADTMADLQSLIVELIGNGALGRLTDVLATADYTAREWDRIHASAGVTVTLPTTITSSTFADNPPPYNVLCDYGWLPSDYGWGVSDYPRSPYNLAPVVQITSAGVPTYSLYNGYTSSWVTINSLAQQDTFPFPFHLENGFACMLAEAIADDHGQVPGPSTKRAAAWCRASLTSRFDNKRGPVRADFF